MLEVSHRYGIPILENESYADFRIDGPPLPQSLAGMDDQNSVLYVSAYTKLLGCGLRLGFGVAPKQVMEVLSRLKFGGSTSQLSAMAAHGFLKDHRGEYVQNVATSLRAKRDAMLTALDEHFPSHCSWSKPHGGMMVWVRLPEDADTWSALDSAVEANVKYNPGALFRAARDRGNYLRLAYSHNSVQEIWDGVAILARVLDHHGLFNG
jgi:2-aminoadipate transaminase